MLQFSLISTLPCPPSDSSDSPARVFWVYGFPTVMAIVLGYAFRNRPPAPIQVDLIDTAGSPHQGGDQEHTTSPSRRISARAILGSVSPPIDIHEGSQAEVSTG